MWFFKSGDMAMTGGGSIWDSQDLAC